MKTLNSSHRLLLAALGLSLAACSPDQQETPEAPERPGPVKVGEFMPVDISSPAFAPTSASGEAELVWEHELSFPDATYIAPHFDHFALPEGARLVVRTPSEIRSRTYTDIGKFVPGEDGFWGMHMPGHRAILRLYSSVPLAAGVVSLDQYARGLEAWNQKPLAAQAPDTIDKAICMADNSEEAKCYQQSEPDAYNQSRAVARVLIGGGGLCTGWLVGNEGHLMTNEHCINNATTAANTSYEFMAEGADCNENCASSGGCPGDVAADSSTLVKVSAEWDYALLKLIPTNPQGPPIQNTYGYFRLRPTGGEVGERIYIPQHPAGWGKRIAMVVDGGNDATISSLSEPPCTAGAGAPDVGYFADTQGGSSGSPVVGYDDNQVVALHHCANCPNRGVPIDKVIEDLGNDLPPSAIGCVPMTTVDAGPDRTICDGDSIMLGTPGLPDHTYSWSPSGQTGPQISVTPNSTTTYTVTATSACGPESDTVTVTVVNDGSCAVNGPQGSSCSTDSECASGFCTDGVCCDQACAGGCEACSVAAGSSADGSCEASASGTMCRGPAGGCDAIETCDGTSRACPVNDVLALDAVCRGPAGGCDSEERCDGFTVNCPADSVQAANTTCRQRRDQCDVAERCDGVTNTCPPDEVRSAGDLCRSAFGGCDAPEYCDGMNDACPADGIQPAGTVCRDSLGVCDTEERCDGASSDCPADVVAPVTVMCRDAAGPCDTAEMCDGVGGSCPEDVIAEAGTVCRDVVGSCDVAESCDGAGIECPADVVMAAGELCRDAAGDCDVAESCDGVAGACPQDSFVAAGESCRAGTGECDPGEACTGSSAACPDDALASDGSECTVGSCSNTATCQAGSCELDEGLCEAPSSGGCSTTGTSGLGAGWLVLLSLVFVTRRRREQHSA